MNRKNVIRLNENQLKRFVMDTVMHIVNESNGFNPTGYRSMSNWGGHEVEINDSGDSARFRFYGGTPTDWMEIEFDEDGVAYVDTERGRERLCDYMRF